MELATAKQMREMERRTIEGGIPSLELMQRAANALAETAREMVEEQKRPDGTYRYLPQATGIVLVGNETVSYEKPSGAHQYRPDFGRSGLVSAYLSGEWVSTLHRGCQRDGAPLEKDRREFGSAGTCGPKADCILPVL